MTTPPVHDPLPADQVAWTWHGSAEPSDLRLQRSPLPTLAADQVLVRNAVIGLNPVDWKVLGGDLVDWRAGKVPGVDGAGQVVAVGAEMPAAWLGQRVCYHQSLDAPGSFAEYTALKAQVLLRVPPQLDLARAASLPCPGLTAWQALDKLPAGAGRELLLAGAGGGVGLYLLQLAVARGWRVSVMCHARHWPRLRALGAIDCLSGPLDSDWRQGERFDAIVDCIGQAHAARLVPALFANGHLLCIQGRLGEWPNPPFGRALSLHEVALGALHRHGDARAWQRLTRAGEQLLAQLADASLHAEELHSAPFSALPEHLRALRDRQRSGKLLVTL
ncbi:MAG: Zinc-type alcohol dehydrogenase-like protein [Pseudomonas citronellolis]|nr:MAG: Zinc-type alcohol dehydrogenase-like protein [Pseudomonas citronellolis]